MNVRSILFAFAFAAMPAVALAQDSNNQTMGEGAMRHGMAAMESMMEDMQGMQPSGDPDMDFAMMMIPHHQAAIEMARIELEQGDDPEMRAMAEMIIEAQEKEIEQLKAWQAKNGH